MIKNVTGYLKAADVVTIPNGVRDFVAGVLVGKTDAQIAEAPLYIGLKAVVQETAARPY